MMTTNDDGYAVRQVQSLSGRSRPSRTAWWPARALQTKGRPRDVRLPVASPLRRSDEVDDLALVPSINAEILAINSEYLAASMQLSHDDDRSVGHVHSIVTRHQRPDTRPVRRHVELQAKRATFEKLEQRIHVDAVFAEEVRNFGQHGLARHHRRRHLLH